MLLIPLLQYDFSQPHFVETSSKTKTKPWTLLLITVQSALSMFSCIKMVILFINLRPRSGSIKALKQTQTIDKHVGIRPPANTITPRYANKNTRLKAARNLQNSSATSDKDSPY